MIFRQFLPLRNAGVLGMNRRNRQYIMGYNRRSSFPLVDDKLLTKQLSFKHGIPTPPLYHVVSYHGDIAGFERALADRQEFVLESRQEEAAEAESFLLQVAKTESS